MPFQIPIVFNSTTKCIGMTSNEQKWIDFSFIHLLCNHIPFKVHADSKNPEG